ncbi:MAG: phage head closure protein [Pseudomonadota bacterium]
MIGRLRHRVALQSAARTGDGGGGGSVAWTTFANVWADVRTLRSSDDAAADRDARLKRYRITLRHRDDVTFETRLVYRGAALEILSIQTEAERGRWLVLDCAEART